MGVRRCGLGQALRVMRSSQVRMGGHCLPVDPFNLTWRVREFQLATESIELVGRVNQQIPYQCVGRIERAPTTLPSPSSAHRFLRSPAPGTRAAHHRRPGSTTQHLPSAARCSSACAGCGSGPGQALARTTQRVTSPVAVRRTGAGSARSRTWRGHRADESITSIREVELVGEVTQQGRVRVAM